MTVSSPVEGARVIQRDAESSQQGHPPESLDRIDNLTLETLQLGIVEAASICKPQDANAWKLLASLAVELAASEHEGILVDGRRWCLKALDVEGFRGAHEPISIRFDSAAGVTVLFGENGSGKSSITEALRMALEGDVGRTHLGGKGQVHVLWGSFDDRSNGAKQACSSVTLCDATDPGITLRLNAQFDGEQVVRDATLSQPHRDPVVIGNDSAEWRAWDSAIRAAPPVFAYSELASELRTRADLQAWLSSCLAMDAAIREFNDAVAKRHRQSRDARSALDSLRGEAERRVDAADRSAMADSVEGVRPLDWAALYECEAIEDWLTSQDLTKRNRLDVMLPVGIYGALKEYANEYLALKRGWERSATEFFSAEVMESIGRLDNAVLESTQSDNGGACPVCGSPDVNWQGHLHSQAITFAAAMKAAKSIRRHSANRNRALVEPLQRCLTVVSSGSIDGGGVADVASLVEAVAEQSDCPEVLAPEVVADMARLCTWLTTKESEDFVNAAVARADRRHSWLCDRREAVSDLVEGWATHSAESRKADDWKKALSRWNSHLSRLRKERSANLQQLVSPEVEALFGDVGIRLDVLEVQKKDITLTLRDRTGDEVALSHLSAGQRNALILAPLIGTAGGGLFEFRVIDDPVHAFDDFRIDQLAKTMSRMGESQLLVLTTHDGRFVEYLRVHAPRVFHVSTLSRSDSGGISLVDTESPWLTLLDSAVTLLKHAGPSITPEGLDDVRSLLRLAIDEALEALFLRYLGSLDADARAVASDSFRTAMDVKRRKKALRRFFSDSPQLTDFDCAYAHVRPYVKSWSLGLHGSQPSAADVDLSQQISAAKASCQELESIRW